MHVAVHRRNIGSHEYGSGEMLGGGGDAGAVGVWTGSTTVQRLDEHCQSKMPFCSSERSLMCFLILVMQMQMQM